MKSDAPTVDAYLASVPDDRRAAIAAVRAVIVGNLPPGVDEAMQYGMIGYSVPLERYPDTYNGEPLGLAALASQKRYIALYLMSVYGDAEQGSWFRSRWESTGRRLDMAKSCVRFRRLEGVPLEVVGAAIARMSVDELIARYERSRA